MIGNSSFKVGIYIRLSRDDGNIESDSIISQRSLLNQYIKENNYKVLIVGDYDCDLMNMWMMDLLEQTLKDHHLKE